MVYNNPPLNNINGAYVNVDNSHYSGSAFTSRVIPSTVNPRVLPEPQSNIQAINSYIPCTKGGTKKYKQKFNNIYNSYKMKGGKNKIKQQLKKYFSLKSIKSKKNLKSKRKGGKNKSMKNNHKTTKRNYKGGYSQYQNNLPMTQTYSTGGILSANQSALASPVPYKTLSNCTNCVDNYSYYTNKGFPSRGWL
jgi:hypothetical protein